MLLIRRRKFAHRDDRGSLREHYICSEHFSSIFHSFLRFSSRLLMFMYVQLITESEDTRLFVSYIRRRQWRSIGVHGSRLSTRFPHVLVFFFLFLIVSLSFSPARSYIRSIPDATSKLYTRGRKGSPTLDSNSRTLPLRSRSIARLPSFSSETLESLLRLFTYYRTYYSFPSFYRSLLGISFRYIEKTNFSHMFRE